MRYFLLLSLFMAGCGSIGSGTKTDDKPVVISSNDKEGLKSELCPALNIRDGAASYRLTTGGDGPLDVRYQATIGEMARECVIDGNVFRMKIGVEGRVVVGPKGSSGTVTVPIRMALMKGLNTPVWSKLYKVPVVVTTAKGGESFVLVENELSFPLPSPAELQTMEIYVGFDPKGDAGEPKKQKKR